ncbi:DNA-directed RNA polymerase subunit alpha [Candidatus Microgenomates bacterium]|nr:DNA-directed RNA polymerase subunit alpha [Candidatus Microgenomates bacterium]
MDLLFTIKKDEERPDYGRFAIEPLEQGYGSTLGTALRRVLLTSLAGSAITSVKIDKVKHPFSTIPGLKEDVIEFLLNLKKMRINYTGTGPAKLTLEKKGPGEVKAADIKRPETIKIANPDLVLATLASRDSKLSAEFQVESGIGFSPAEDRHLATLGVIPVDAIFSPITRVNYRVEATRVGRLTNYDKLILELWTDGTITPGEAIKKSAEILATYFNQIVSPQVKNDEEVVEKPKIAPTLANLSVEELNLPARIANALVRGGYENVGQLVSANPQELARVRNLGEKSIKVISAALGEHGIQFP